MQVANGIDLLWEGDHISPLIVYCPPMVAKGSWMCSERQPLPECSLSCPSGLVPASKDRVDCENKTHFACVPAAAAILGGLDSDDQPVNYTEVFTFRDGFLQQLNQNTPNTSSISGTDHTIKKMTSTNGTVTESQLDATMGLLSTVSATSEWFNGQLVTCGGIYRRSCSSLVSSSAEFEEHSVLNNWHEGASSNVLGPSLQLRGSIVETTQSLTEVYSIAKGWTVGSRVSETGNQTCIAQINATHVTVSGMSETDPDGWLVILTSEGEVAKVDMLPVGGGRWAHGCVAYDDKVLIAGGFDKDGYITDSSAILELSFLQWRNVSRMELSRAAFSRLVVMENYAWAFGGFTDGDGIYPLDTVERFHLQNETWEVLWEERLSVRRSHHTVSSVPLQQWTHESSSDDGVTTDPTEEDDSTYIHPEFQSPVVEGLDKYHAIVTMVLIYVPTLYVCISNLTKSLGKNNNIVFKSLSTILIPFPIIQTLISFVVFKIFPRDWLQMIKPQDSDMKELDVQKMKAEVQMAGTFYNSCPSICLQILIIISFPDREIRWFQIASVCISSVTALWNAANLYQLQLEAENDDTKEKLGKKIGKFFSNLPLKLKSVLLSIPLLLSSMVFNFTNIILGIINNNFFILFYLLAAFISVLLPATFSPADSINKLEKVLGLGLDQEKLKENTNADGKNSRKSTGQVAQPPTTGREMMKNVFRGINMAYINIFCIARPICNPSPAVRHYMVGLYPLHFVVNMASLLFQKYFGTTHVVTIRGIIFNINTIILIAIAAGLVNLVLFILFYYPDIFPAMARCLHKRKILFQSASCF